ncbi:hypothetical protein CQW23_24399 [Capsicum baccatum]|uniref:DUF4220 domain-containing protein n=1 Tax=Capsicum baccatum TaxID=33114 RepID=A0A2G2VUN0_CAPBA|nr:hypothetical protein CQW23_24399 [Capsicum baccatum]
MNYEFEEIWEAWDIRVVILFILTLQIILIFFAPHRKCVSTNYLTLPLWCSYLLVEWAVNFTVGHISDSNGNNSAGGNKVQDVLVFPRSYDPGQLCGLCFFPNSSQKQVVDPNSADICGQSNQNEIQNFFLILEAIDAFRVIEVEHNFIYDVLSTKMIVANSYWGYLFRLICFLLEVVAAILFYRWDKRGLPRELIHEEIKNKSPLTEDLDTANMILLVWHIATELCYSKESNVIDGDTEKSSPANADDAEKPPANYREISKILSDYMLYLLVMQPAMMSVVAAVGQIRYRDTCAEAEKFLRSRNVILNTSKDQGNQCVTT